MINYTGNTSTLARVYYKEEESNKFIYPVNISDFHVDETGRYYNSDLNLYIDLIITEGTNVYNKQFSAFYYGKLIITKIAYGLKTIWELVSSCFGSGKWKEDLKWSDTEIWIE